MRTWARGTANPQRGAQIVCFNRPDVYLKSGAPVQIQDLKKGDFMFSLRAYEFHIFLKSIHPQTRQLNVACCELS